MFVPNRAAIARYKLNLARVKLPPLLNEIAAEVQEEVNIDTSDLQRSVRVAMDRDTPSGRVIVGGTRRSLPEGARTPKGRSVRGVRVDYAIYQEFLNPTLRPAAYRIRRF